MKRLSLLLLTCFCLVLLSGCGNIAVDTEIYPQDGKEIATIDGEPYYYNEDYLFKVLGSVPIESTGLHEEIAIMSELLYLEALEQNISVSESEIDAAIDARKEQVSLLEKTIQACEENLKLEDLPETEIKSIENMIITSQDIIAMQENALRNCLQHEGLTEEDFWKSESIRPYVEKGTCIAQYIYMNSDQFPAADVNDMQTTTEYYYHEYKDSYLYGFDDLIKKYHVVLIPSE